MEQRIELAPGYTVSRVINGCWQLSEGHNLKGSLDWKDIMKAFHELAELGFTTFDCADIYTGAEDFIGAFVRELKAGHGVSPDEIQVHTKYVPDIGMLSSVDMKYTEGIIDRCLKRQNRDALDLVQFHWWDYGVPGYLDTAWDLVRLMEKGKIRHIGVTNMDTAHLRELVEAGIPVISSQSQYSLFDRRVEKGYAEYCAENGISLLCYGTLSGGFLSERWIGRDGMGDPETRSQIKYLQVIEDTLGWEGYQKLLLLLREIGGAHGVSLSNVATAYVLTRKAAAAAIIGIRNSRHVRDNVRIFRVSLSEDEIRAIRDLLASYPDLEGEPFQLERTVGSKYRNIMHMNINEEENP